MTNNPQVLSVKDVGRHGPGCLIQVIWFIFVGWWLGAWATVIAWLLNITIIGLPLGLLIINNLPILIALIPEKRQQVLVQSGSRTVVMDRSLPQHNFILRALYFLLIGWWWSAVWMLLAYVLCLTILLMPVGFWMFSLAPLMTTLKRY
jgi:uncharacterized membrane protein YccF (DUF307 family)